MASGRSGGVASGRSGGVITITSLLGAEFGALVAVLPSGMRRCMYHFTIFFFLSVGLLPSPGLFSEVVRSIFLGGPPFCASKLWIRNFADCTLQSIYPDVAPHWAALDSSHGQTYSLHSSSGEKPANQLTHRHIITIIST